jgi:hypothetical protein
VDFWDENWDQLPLVPDLSAVMKRTVVVSYSAVWNLGPKALGQSVASAHRFRWD